MKITYYKIDTRWLAWGTVDAEFQDAKYATMAAAKRDLLKARVNLHNQLDVTNIDLRGTPYEDYAVSEQNFIDGLEPAYIEEAKGFYRLIGGDTIKEEKETSIVFRKPFYIQFFEAKRVKLPEVKEEGKPYQSAKVNIEIIRESVKFPLNRAGSRFGIGENLFSPHSKTVQYEAIVEFFIDKHEIEIKE